MTGIKPFRFGALHNTYGGVLRARLTCSLAFVLFSVLEAELMSAAAQTKLEATYAATLLGISIGEISWTVDLRGNRFKASARGAISGLLRILSDGQGDVSAHGAIAEGKPVPTDFTLSLVAGKWSDNVRIVFSDDKAQEYVATASPNATPDQVPLTEADRKGVLDPMTAMLIPVRGGGNTIVSQAFQRNIPVFDGHARYNLQLAFKRFQEVKTNGGYQGSSVVCRVSFIPIAGHDPKRYLVTYLAAHRDIEVWLVPLAGSRLLVPYRAAMPTPVGRGVLEATSFAVRPLKQ